jgi:sarcosine oxidase delta subunit
VRAESNDETWISCPYCGESSELMVHSDGGAIQEYVEDCEVCCHPWLVRVRLDGEGTASVSVTTLDDE